MMKSFHFFPMRTSKSLVTNNHFNIHDQLTRVTIPGTLRFSHMRGMNVNEPLQYYCEL